MMRALAPRVRVKIGEGTHVRERGAPIARTTGGRMLLFTFDTTHHALWAEEIAREREIPADVVPAPPEANARCSLALETLEEDVSRLEEALRAEALPFRIHAG